MYFLAFIIFLSAIIVGCFILVAAAIVGGEIHRIEAEMMMYRNTVNQALKQQAKKS
jgi:hypothetical protein